jgi:hypothetical protein
MPQTSTWVGRSHLVAQEFPRIWSNPQFCDCVHGLPILLLIPELYQSVTHRRIPFVEDKIILISTLTSSKQSLTFRFPTKILYYVLISPVHAIFPTHPPPPLLFNNHDDVWREIRSMKLLVLQSSPTSFLFFLFPKITFHKNMHPAYSVT